MITICSAMASVATFGEKFFSQDNPMNSLTGLLSPQKAEGSADDAKTSGGVTLITPTGKLTGEQRAWLLEQAKKGAPIPLDNAGAPTAPEAQRAATLDELEKALKEAGG